MDNYKIKVKDEAESKDAQELFFELGASRPDGTKNVYHSPTVFGLLVVDGLLNYVFAESVFYDSKAKKLTLPQLRDLVTQSKSNVREYLDPNDNYKLCLIDPADAAYWMIEVPEGAEFCMEMRVGLKVGCKFFFKFDDEDLRVLSGSGWQHASYDSIQEHVDEGDQLLWSRETVKKDPALISGAEALRALADGKDVDVHESTYKQEVWFNLKDTNYKPDEILAEKVRNKPYKLTFRLKPPTISVNAELPKPNKETQKNTEVYAVTYEFKTREDRNVFADKLRGTNS